MPTAPITATGRLRAYEAKVAKDMNIAMVPKKRTRSCAEATAAWVPGSDNVSDMLMRTAMTVSGISPPAKKEAAKKERASATLSLTRRLFAGGSLHSGMADGAMVGGV